MSENRKRILFLCAHRSIRSLMAVSLLVARAQRPWDAWTTSVTDNASEYDLARQVFDEMGIPLLESPQISEPSFGLSWDEGVILCSGMADT
jgi:protein-tyrosine-phosphatase